MLPGNARVVPRSLDMDRYSKRPLGLERDRLVSRELAWSVAIRILPWLQFASLGDNLRLIQGSVRAVQYKPRNPWTSGASNPVPLGSYDRCCQGRSLA